MHDENDLSGSTIFNLIQLLKLLNIVKTGMKYMIEIDIHTRIPAIPASPASSPPPYPLDSLRKALTPMEEAAQILEIETFIPMLLQVRRGRGRAQSGRGSAPPPGVAPRPPVGCRAGVL